MSVQVIAPEPTHGRPRILEVRTPRCGLDVHFEYGSRALWLFARGPRGGDRGHIVIAARLGDKLLAWMDAGAPRSFYCGPTGSIALAPLRLVPVLRPMVTFELSEGDQATVRECLRSWASALTNPGEITWPG